MTGTDNVGNAASITSTVKVDTTAPTAPSLAYGSESNVAVNGTYVYYRPGAASGSFTVTASSTDPETGIASYTFPSLGSGWSVTGTGMSRTYSWSAANPTTASGNLTVTATNGASINSSGSNTTNPFTMVADSTAPTGGAVTVNGTAASGGGSSSSTSSTSFTITSRTDYTETQSSTQSGLASSTLTMQSETLSGHTCGSPGSGGPFTSPTTISGTTQPSGITRGFCYLYTLTGTDNVGNATSISTTVQVSGIVFVQQQTLNVSPNGAGVSSLSLTLTNAIAQGDALVLIVADQSQNSSVVNTVTETGATWTKATSTGSTSNGDAEIWYALNVPSSASTTINVNLTGTTNVQIADVSEYSGVATSGALDKTANANNTSASVSAGSVTPSQSGELVVSDAYVLNGNSTQPAPTNSFTSLLQSPGLSGNYRGYGAYLVDGSSSGISTTWTEPGGAGSWAAAIASFEP